MVRRRHSRAWKRYNVSHGSHTLAVASRHPGAESLSPRRSVAVGASRIIDVLPSIELSSGPGAMCSSKFSHRDSLRALYIASSEWFCSADELSSPCIDKAVDRSNSGCRRNDEDTPGSCDRTRQGA